MKLPTTLFKFILHFIKESWVKFSLIFFVTFFFALTSSAFPYVIKRIVNILENYQGDPAHVYSAVGGILLMLAVLLIVNDLVQNARAILKIYTYPGFRAQIREEVFDYVKLHSHGFFSEQLVGSMAQKIANLPATTEEAVEIVLSTFSFALVTIILVSWMVWVINPIFVVIIFVWLFLHGLISYWFFRYGNPAWSKYAHSVAILTGRIVDVLSNISSIRLFVRDRYEAEHLKQYQQDEIKQYKQAMWMLEIAHLIMGIFSLTLILTVIFTLIYGWSYGWVSFGDFTQVSMQVLLLVGSVWQVTLTLSRFVKQTGTIEDALSLIRKRHDVQDKKNAQTLIVSHGEIRFNQVTFYYHRNRPVFSGLDIQVSAGQKVGLVGQSGAGKSTLVNLILRLYDVNAGAILIDGQNIASVTQDSLRSAIGMIPQDPILFQRSLMENIRYGRLDASDEEVIAASKLAHCHEFIEKLDNGYASLIGEAGIQLSGGQRQRIAIARTILKNAPILILDEATSALDSVTEKLIHESLHHLMQGKTTFAIAHRLSTLVDMDRILVFSKGEIVEDGSVKQLLAANGYFSKLWKLQVNGYLSNSLLEEF